MTGEPSRPDDHDPVRPLPDGRAAGPEHVPLDQTTLPRHAAPDLGPAPHLVVIVGEDGEAARAPARPGDRHCPVEVPDIRASVTTALAGLTTGWRIAAVGRERDVLAVRAAALAAGALDAEITLVPTDVPGSDGPEDTRVRLVFCGACHRRFDAAAAVREHVACPGCRAVLTVAAHHSRRHGAFLGAPAGRRE